MLRPIPPRDLDGLRALFERSSTTAGHQRSGVDTDEMSTSHLAEMCKVDFRGDVGFVITTTCSDKETIVADARYAVTPGGASAEVSVLVQPYWRRRGLGRRAVRALVDAAHRSGLRCLHANVMRTNAPMLLLLHRCGFAVGVRARMPGFVEMRRDVSTIATRSSCKELDGCPPSV